MSIYLDLRVDSEYLEYLGEVHQRKFNYEAFDWCRLENAETGMKLPSREELDESVTYLSIFLEDFRDSLSLEELGRVVRLETALARWRMNAHLLYSRAMEFIAAAVAVYYGIPKYITGDGRWNEKAIYFKLLFEDLEGVLLENLDQGESKELMGEILEGMDAVLNLFDSLSVHMDNSGLEAIERLRGLRDSFEIESLLSSRF